MRACRLTRPPQTPGRPRRPQTPGRRRGTRPLVAAARWVWPGRDGREARWRRGAEPLRAHGGRGRRDVWEPHAGLPTYPADPEPRRGGAGTSAGAGPKAMGPDRSVAPAQLLPGCWHLLGLAAGGPEDPALGTGLRCRSWGVLWVVVVVVFTCGFQGLSFPPLRWGLTPRTRVWGQGAIAPAGAARGWRAWNERDSGRGSDTRPQPATLAPGRRDSVRPLSRR